MNPQNLWRFVGVTVSGIAALCVTGKGALRNRRGRDTDICYKALQKGEGGGGCRGKRRVWSGSTKGQIERWVIIEWPRMFLSNIANINGVSIVWVSEGSA